MVSIENAALCRSITYAVEDMPGATSLNDRGGAYDQGVYVCESKDMDDKHQLLKPEVYNLSLEQLGVLQGNLLGYVSAQMRSLRTSTDRRS